MKREISDWYNEYSDSIFKYILMMIHDHHQAEDLTHDTFIKAYRNYHSFQKKSNPKTWLFSIAHNVTVDYIRKKKPIHVIKEILAANKDSGPTPDEIVELKENSHELYQALGNLKQAYREVIIIRKIKGFSTKETTEILNWSESKVKTTLYRAMTALEKQMVKEGDHHEKTTG
ncbi:RNA polymerase sigma factor [Desertibacillus haloalkaliphilus]|nr:RNA polymerase sigma factor [Desertibacillus haloalkaliphilus]